MASYRKCDTCGKRLKGTDLYFRELDRCIKCRAKDYAREVREDEEAERGDVYFVGPDNSSEDFQRHGLGWIDPMERRWLEGD